MSKAQEYLRKAGRGDLVTQENNSSPSPDGRSQSSTSSGLSEDFPGIPSGSEPRGRKRARTTRFPTAEEEQEGGFEAITVKEIVHQLGGYWENGERGERIMLPTAVMSKLLLWGLAWKMERM